MNKSESKYFATAARMDEAFLALLDKKNFAYITVKEICEAAGVNRSTFYLHYADIYDMLCKIEEELIQEIEEALQQYPLGDEHKSRKFLCRMFEIMTENREIYKALCGQNGDTNFVVRLENLVAAEALRSLAPLFRQMSKRELSFLYAYCLNGCVGIVKMWLIYDGKETPEEMAGILVRMVANCLREYHTDPKGQATS